MEFSRQEYCSGLPFPSPEDLLNPGIKPGSNPGIKPGSPALQVDSLPSEPPGQPRSCQTTKYLRPSEPSEPDTLLEMQKLGSHPDESLFEQIPRGCVSLVPQNERNTRIHPIFFFIYSTSNYWAPHYSTALYWGHSGKKKLRSSQFLCTLCPTVGDRNKQFKKQKISGSVKCWKK